jgi:hypothetical protein
MTVLQGKVKIVFDVYANEKKDFEDLCTALHKTKIDFFREAIKNAQRELDNSKSIEKEGV